MERKIIRPHSIVRAREDGTNVNKWHWQERKVSDWAHARIRELLAIATIATSTGATVESLDIEGDAMLYNRKGVLKVLYDLKVTGKWRSAHELEDARTTGTYRFELFDDDPEVSCAMDAKSRCDVAHKHAVASALQPRVESAARTFVAELRAGAGQPLDGVQLHASKKPAADTKVTDFLRSGMHQPPAAQPKAPPARTVVDLHQRFNCSAMDLYRALTERAQLEAVTRSRCESDAVEGGAFSLMKGTVTGTYKKLLPAERIEMSWKMSSWKCADGDDGALAVVTMKRDENACALHVRLSNVPSEYKSETSGFWHIQVFQAIRVVLGYGYGGAGFF